MSMRPFHFTAIAAAAAAGAGGAPIVIDPAADFFFDDFNGTNASLTGRAGWNVVGDATKAGKIVADNGVARMMTGYNGASPYGYQFTGDLGTNKRVSFHYDFSQDGAALDDVNTPFKRHDQQYILAWTDESNYTYITFDKPSATYRGRVYRVVAGTFTVVLTYEGLPAVAEVTIEMTDRMRMYVNGVITVPSQLFNDVNSVYPDRLFDGTTVLNGPVGFRHSFHPVAFSKYVRVNPLEVTVTDPKAFFGRDATNKRSITFAGTYSGTPTSWAYRLRLKSNGSTVRDWGSLAATAAAGSWSAAVSVDSGGPYVIDVAWIGADGKARIATSTHFAVGILVGIWGQSNAGGSSNSQAAFSDPTNLLVYGYDSANAYAGSFYERWWSATEQVAGTYLPNISALAKSLSAATGVPVGVFGAGVASQPITNLKPGTSNWDTKLAPLTVKVGGNVEHWIWSQGEAEALALSSSATYVADFAAVVAGFRSIGGRSDAGVFIRLIGEDTAVTVNSTTTARAVGFRALQQALENPSDNIWVASHPLGAPLVDTIHFTAAGHIELCRREGLTIARRAYGALAYDGRGPVVTGATRAGAVITLAVDLNGATGISGSALTGYTVSADNFTTALTISSVNVSGSTIVITLAADPGGPVKVGSYREASYDNSSIAIGAYADGTTIPVMPIAAPVTTTS